MTNREPTTNDESNIDPITSGLENPNQIQQSLKLSCDNETFEVVDGCKRILDPTVSNYYKDMEAYLKEEELAIIKMQKKLMQVKYDLLKYQYNKLEVNHTKLKDKLEAYTCSICLTNYKNCILEPCGHFVCCDDCIFMIPDNKCPLCRCRNDYYTKVFNS